MNFPVTVEVATPERIANWRPLVHWLLAIPHFIVMYFLQLGASVVAFLTFFAVLFTKNIPEGLYNFQAMALRYQTRVGAYVGFLYEEYPPFTFDAVAVEPGGSPVVMSVPERPEEMNRFLPLIKWLLVIPQSFVLFFFGIGAFILYIGAFFSVLFTGKFPEGTQRFIVRLMRWSLTINAYMFMMTDAYPAFTPPE